MSEEEKVRSDERAREMEELHNHWRKNVFKSYWIIAGVVFLAEIIMALIFILGKRALTDIPAVYLAKYLIAPTVLNVVNILCFQSIQDSFQAERSKNLSIIGCMLVMCTLIATVHGFFTWTKALFVLPIFISVVEGKKKVTLYTAAATVPCLYFSTVIGVLYDRGMNMSDELFQATLSLLLLAVATVMSLAINRFLTSKDELIARYDKQEGELSHALTLDAMTSLYNHAEFNRMLAKQREYCRKQHHYMSVVVADIDHFKTVNDTYGHEQGDKVLINVAAFLQHFCSDKGTVFRYGGEEFAVILMDSTSHETLAIMEEVRDALSKEVYDFMPPDQRVTISIGIYKYGGEEDIEASDIFNNADSAMYQAKTGGRNRCVIYKKPETVTDK